MQQIGKWRILPRHRKLMNMGAPKGTKHPPRMRVHPGEPLERIVDAARRVALSPWMFTRSDLQRAQRTLTGAGFKNLADSLQTFIDEPPLPLKGGGS